MNCQVSIIIVNYNSEKYLSACLDSIYTELKGLVYEIIIVDNNSTSRSRSFIKQEYPNIKLLVNDENKGFGAANNRGAKLAKGDYLFFLNPDTILLDNAVLKFYQFLEEKGADVVSCGGDLINKNEEPTVSYGNSPSFLQEFGDTGFRKLFQKYYDQHLRIGKSCYDLIAPTQVPYITGADIFIRKAAFLDIGGFDESFFLYYEETDLYYRLNQAGYSSYILPDVKIIHLEGPTLFDGTKLNVEKWAIWEKSKYYYFRKNKGILMAKIIKAMQLISLIIHYFFGSPKYSLLKTFKITWKA